MPGLTDQAKSDNKLKGHPRKKKTGHKVLHVAVHVNDEARIVIFVTMDVAINHLGKK